MIQANELRLNNWVYSHEIGDNVQISSISEEGVHFKDCVTWDYPTYEEIHPIELTEEILLKCGFEKGIVEPKYYYIKGMMIWKGNDIFLCNKTDVVINHLHQLQNLYHALTGEELEINL